MRLQGVIRMAPGINHVTQDVAMKGQLSNGFNRLNSALLSLSAQLETKATPEEVLTGSDETIPGVITSNILPLNVAIGLLAEFFCWLLPEYPILGASADDGFDLLRITKPILSLGVITAASRASNPALFRKLHS